MKEGERGVRLRVKVVPRASRTEFRGRMADGTVRIALKAPPVDGKANDELLRFLASEFGVPLSSVRLLSGTSSRKKLLSIETTGSPPRWLRESR